MIPSILFYLFSGGLLGAALCAMVGQNLVASVLFLIICFFNAAGMFLLLNAEFLAFSLVIVYVGAIAVLFLFVVMMMNIEKHPWRDHLHSYRLYFVFFALLLMTETILIGFGFQNNMSAGDVIAHAIPQNAETNTHHLAKILYTHHLLAFQLAGIVLLVAMIGAIVLCYEKRHKLRRQNIADQIKRSNTVYLADPAIGEGVQY